jgi:predicted nucleic acid-binding protein
VSTSVVDPVVDGGVMSRRGWGAGGHKPGRTFSLPEKSQCPHHARSVHCPAGFKLADLNAAMLYPVHREHAGRSCAEGAGSSLIGTSIQRLVVVDANAIIASVDNDCRKRRRSRMLEGAARTGQPLFASKHIYDEVYRRIPKVARSSPVPLEKLIAHFERAYLPVLRFVDVDMSNRWPGVEEVTDPDDQPTAQLACLLSPAVVYSEDKHLRRPGIAPPDWRATAGSMVAIARATQQRDDMMKIAVLPVWGVWRGSAAIARRLKLPLGFAVVPLAALAAGVTACIWRKPEPGGVWPGSAAQMA